ARRGYGTAARAGVERAGDRARRSGRRRPLGRGARLPSRKVPLSRLFELARAGTALPAGEQPGLADEVVGVTAQGLGGALLEELAYDPGGQLVAGSFMDYLLPTAGEVPAVEVLITEDAPTLRNPLGAKGAGEGGVAAVGAAVANAVSDALGVEVTRLPLSPERVLAL